MTNRATTTEETISHLHSVVFRLQDDKKHLNRQIDALADYIVNNFSSDIKDGGAVEVAMDVMDRLDKENKRYHEALETIQDIQQWHRKQPDHEVLDIVNKVLERST